ncbi:MAG TPA: TMEM175 family protein [Candidatus Limnocylindrales bacterium]
MTASSPSPVSDPGVPRHATESTARLSPTARVEAFSDGVMAIAITLLVLDLKVPTDEETRQAGSLAAALADRWPSYVAYLAAFLTIGIIWLNHRTLVDRIARFDARLHWLNLMLLLGVVTLPFPTSLVADYVERGGADASAATALYGLCATLMSLPWGFVWRHLADRPELLEPGYDAAYARAEWRRGSLGVPIYATATLVALVAPLVSLALYLSIAALYAVTSQGVPVGPAESMAD